MVELVHPQLPSSITLALSVRSYSEDQDGGQGTWPAYSRGVFAHLGSRGLWHLRTRIPPQGYGQSVLPTDGGCKRI